jgi:hypothetical protein
MGLRDTLENAGGSLTSLTVLAPQNDPFRVDTPAGHRDGQWLADKLVELKLSGPRHLRGLHYALIGQPKPNGLPYTNTAEDWQWLATPAKCARWLGYIPFDRIVDQRNDEPQVTSFTRYSFPPYPYITTPSFKVELPDADKLQPQVWLSMFHAEQPYRIVLVGEKSSLRPILSRVAARYAADLYLPTGEISDTQVYLMASNAAEDGRPMACFYFSDCDPSGWQMPISLSRKLQALKALEFPDIEFEVHRVGLTPDQAKEYGLPSTPLKDTERRADKWFEATGVEQTEIDAAIVLQPDLLMRLAVEAVSEYFDSGLESREWAARSDWQREAQAVLDAAGNEQLEQLRTQTAAALAEKRAEIEELMEKVEVDPESMGITLPDVPDVPEPEVYPNRTPLCDSRWEFTVQCEELIASKQYRQAVAR